jgi:hypothetical protein
MDAAEFEQFCQSLEQISMPTPAAKRWWTRQILNVRQAGMLLLLARNNWTAPLFESLAIEQDYLTVYATENPVIYPFPHAPGELPG